MVYFKKHSHWSFICQWTMNETFIFLQSSLPVIQLNCKKLCCSIFKNFLHVLKPYSWDSLGWFFCFLAFVAYLKPKPFFLAEEEQWYSLPQRWGYLTFPLNIDSNMTNFAYFEATLRQFNHLATRTSPPLTWILFQVTRKSCVYFGVVSLEYAALAHTCVTPKTTDWNYWE